MYLIGPGLSNHVDLSAAKLAIFGIEIARENAELGNRIKVRHNRSAHVYVFLGIAPIYDEGVRKLALSIDRNGAGGQIAGRRKKACADILNRICIDGRGGRTSGLQREQVSETAPVQWNGGHFTTCDHFPQLRG